MINFHNSGSSCVSANMAGIIEKFVQSELLPLNCCIFKTKVALETKLSTLLNERNPRPERSTQQNGFENKLYQSIEKNYLSAILSVESGLQNNVRMYKYSSLSLTSPKNFTAITSDLAENKIYYVAETDVFCCSWKNLKRLQSFSWRRSWRRDSCLASRYCLCDIYLHITPHVPAKAEIILRRLLLLHPVNSMYEA